MRFSKSKLASITGVALLGFVCSSAQATDYRNQPPISPETNLPMNVQTRSVTDGFYLGAFGGYGAPMHNNLSQTGTAFFPSGPLVVDASGRSRESFGGGWGGLHVGYEWSPFVMSPCWSLVPAVELEGYYMGVTEKGDVTNATIAEHDFRNTLPMHTWVIMADTVWALKIPQWDAIPYIGVGIGTADISISGANSLQTSPSEPGVNHFNSNTKSSRWAFAAQGRGGIRLVIDCHWRVFAEYRYLYITATNYTFGQTIYPTHVPTTNWGVGIGGMSNNMGALGIEYTI